MRQIFLRLTPWAQFRNPVMFVTYWGAIFSTYYLFRSFSWFYVQIAIWLWLTVLFSNIADYLAESRGKARAESLRKMQPEKPIAKGTMITVKAGEIIPADGEVVDGVAMVDESAITGESAPVIRESGGERAYVTAGTKVLSDQLVVKVTSDPGASFLDRIIHLVEGAKRQKTPNEIALNILLSALTLVFLLTVTALHWFLIYSHSSTTLPILIALLVCLIPTTIGALLNAIGIAGMDRLIKCNVVAKSGHAVEAAGDVHLLMLDKTGTITLGNRMAVEFIPSAGVDVKTLAEVSQLASLSDLTPEGRSVVVLAKDAFGLKAENIDVSKMKFIPFTAETRMSGVNINGREIRKGAQEAIQKYVGVPFSEEIHQALDRVSMSGGTPLVVSDNKHVMGVIHLKDVVKEGIKEKFATLRKMGIRTLMVTGDNPKTAAAIAHEAGVDDFLAEANPELKLERLTQEQAKGVLVAMAGDGTNDAPALAQADVGVAMNTGTGASREAGNMVDLDNNPTKLLKIIEIGKQLLMTRGTLTTFSVANDVAKYFTILPAIFGKDTYGGALYKLNIMHLYSTESAILSAVIFNALVIIALVPLALKGVAFRAQTTYHLLLKNILIYGVGGVIAPFIGIKVIDMIITSVGLI